MPVTWEDCKAAHKRISEFVERTPVITNAQLDNRSRRNVSLKCENFQKSGGFKYRGAINAVLKLREKRGNQKMPHLVSHSTGNFAHALALAALENKIQCTVVMPKSILESKRKDAEIEYKAKVVLCDENTEECREQKAKEVLRDLGPEAYFVPPSDDFDVIAGHASCVIEFLEDRPQLNAILCAAGGGGMLAACCLAAKHIKPEIKIFGAAPKNADSCAQSFAARKRVTLKPQRRVSLADSLMVNIGELTWPIIKDNVEDIITVSEEEIIDAMKFAFEKMKLIIEPTTAVGIAALLSEKFMRLDFFEVENVGVILCGGNADLKDLPWLRSK